MSSSPAAHGDSMGILPYATIIAKNDISNIENLISCFQKKVCLEQLFLSKVLFQSLYFLNDSYFLERPSLLGKPFLSHYYLFITFVNFEDTYLVKLFLHNLFPCFDVAFLQL